MKVNKERLKELAKQCMGFEPFPYQLDFISDCFEHKYILACWSRQIGKSTCTALFACLAAVLNPDITIIIISKSERQSKEIYIKVLDFLHRVPEFRKGLKQESMEQTILANRSRILNLPCSFEGQSLRGYAAEICIIDEAQFIPDQVVDEVISPFVATKKDFKFIKLSTPQGKQGHFYRSFLDKDYHVHNYSYVEGVRNGLITREFIDKKRMEMDSLSFAQEYEALFIEEASSYFGSELINNNVQDYPLLSEVSNVESGTFYAGYDVGRFGMDKSVLIVVQRKKEENRIVFIGSIDKASLDTQLDYIKRMDKLFHFKKIVLDESAVGGGLTDFLIKEFNTSLIKKVEGLTFTNKSKKDIYSNLRTLLENRQLILPRHPELISQLKDLQYEYSDSGNLKIFHPPNKHDDYPDALALAVKYVKDKESAWFFVNNDRLDESYGNVDYTSW